MSICYLSAWVDKQNGSLWGQWYAVWNRAQRTRQGLTGSLKDVINGHGHTHTHTLFAMHNLVVSLFLCSVRRDGEQKAEQGDFIIPAVFILHPTDCTSHPPFLFSFHCFIISLHPSPVYTNLILSSFKPPTLFLHSILQSVFYYFIRVLLTILSLLFPLCSSRGCHSCF